MRGYEGEYAPVVAAVVVDSGQLYWLETGANADGDRITTVWRTGLGGGPVRRLSDDRSEVVYLDSAYDLQLVRGRLYWIAAGPDGTNELRSVPADGGIETVRVLDRPYSLTAWPWATSSGTNLRGPVRLLNLETGEVRQVPGAQTEVVNCTPVWCRVITLIDEGQSLRFDIERPDGSGRRGFGDSTRTPLNNDVALLDRFEVLGSATSSDSSTHQRLWLYDLSTSRAVLLDEATSGSTGSRNGFLWWSTGDNETMLWHMLDLRQLA